ADPLQAGFLVAPTPLAMGLLAPLTGWMSDKFLPERLCSLGLIINAVAFLSLSLLSAETTSVDGDFMAECSRFRHGSVSNPEQQLVDELTSTPALGSRVVFFVDRPQPGQCGWSNLGGDPRERATRCGNGANFAAKSWRASRNRRWSTGARRVPAGLSLHLSDGSGTLLG